MASLDLASFFAELGLVEVTAQLDDNTSTSERGSGTLNRSSYGQRIWGGTVNIRSYPNAQASQIAAKIQYLQEADSTFQITPAWVADTANTTGTLDAIDADRRVLTLSEARSDGEIIGIANSTTRTWLRVVSRAGLVHTVVPALPLSLMVGDQLTFGRPFITVVIVDAQLPAYRRPRGGQTSFSWRQVLQP